MSMTDEQIAKALKTLDDALALIKRQQAEIEDLKADKEALINGQLTLQKMYLESRAEAVRDIATEYDAYKEAVEVALVETRAEAIRKFAERLKETNLYEFIEEYFDNAELCYEVRSDLFNDFVDNLVKEMTEKEGDKE